MFFSLGKLKLFPLISVTISVLILSGCEGRSDNSNNSFPEESEVSTPTKGHEAVKKQFQNYVDKGDLDAILSRNTLRLISPRWEESGLPRSGLPSSEYRAAAESFAARIGVKPEWIYVDSLAELIPALNEGDGDIIVTHLTQNSTREKSISFSLPLSQSEDVIVTLANKEKIELLAQLSNKRVIVPSGSSFIESLGNVKQKIHDLKFDVLETEKDEDPDSFIARLINGEADATVFDSDVLEQLMSYRTDITQGLALTGQQPIAWGVRKNAKELLSSLNQFLTETRILQEKNKIDISDFEGIKQRKTLRMLTRNNPASYFLWKGELMGFEYELVKRFSEKHKLRLEVVVVPPEENLIEWLMAGRGDLVASAMTISDARREKGVEFTRYYNKVNEQFVSSEGKPKIDDVKDLEGRTLVVKKQHAYWKTANSVLESGISFQLVTAPDSETSVDILNKVNSGEYDATLIDSHLLATESKFLPNVFPGLKLEPARKHGWAVRKENTELLKELNSYIKQNYRGLFFNLTYNKYFKNTKRIGKYQGERLNVGENLSPYDELVQPLAQSHQFDWRLVISQMYQESRFDPSAKSFAGALGLMQVMPRTADELGYQLPLTPETGINAGVEYLNWTRDRFEDYLPIDERLWFSLAAYNAGFGHVRDARRLAAQKGWRDDKWFGHVENAMLLLSKKEYYRNARFGYVRGKEPVNYVREIRDRYNAYLALSAN